MRMTRLLAGFTLTLSVATYADTVSVSVQRAAVEHDDQMNQDVVDVALTPNVQHNLAAFTRERVGRVIHIRADDATLASPTVMSPIEGDALRLSPGANGFGGMSAQEIAKRLDAGGVIVVSDDK